MTESWRTSNKRQACDMSIWQREMPGSLWCDKACRVDHGCSRPVFPLYWDRGNHESAVCKLLYMVESFCGLQEETSSRICRLAYRCCHGNSEFNDALIYSHLEERPCGHAVPRVISENQSERANKSSQQELARWCELLLRALLSSNESAGLHSN